MSIYEPVLSNADKEHNLQSVFDALALRIYKTWSSYDKAQDTWEGYWHPDASLPIIATLSDFANEIGNQKIESIQELKTNAMKYNREPLQRLWSLFVGEFVFKHFIDRSMWSCSEKNSRLKLKGIFQTNKYPVGLFNGELYSSHDKRKFTRSFSKHFKVVVPKNHEFSGAFFDLFSQTNQRKTISAGKEFFAHVSKCPLSQTFDEIPHNNSVTGEHCCKYELMDFMVPVTPIDNETVNRRFAYVSNTSDFVPLYWFTHHKESNRPEWISPNWKSKAINYVKNIFS